MTPEQLAYQAWDQIVAQFDLLELQNLVLRAVYNAVMYERERCAQVAESFIPSGFTSDGKAGDTYAIARDDRARTIAAAIRALTVPTAAR